MRKPLALGLGTALIASLLAATAPSASAVPGDDSTVFINELHYDNDGADAGEFVEIAGPAGTDLEGWQVVLYNGTASQRAPYDTENLTRTLGDDSNGYGFTVIEPSSIQNGSPDGVALVDPGGTLVQFLSYEGTFTGAGGPADGETSTDIGVEEPANTPAGDSLQLTGSGPSYGDFAWTGPAEDSPGAPNAGQTFTAPDDAPILTDCADVTLEEGEGGSAQLSASDADGTVTGAEITSEPVEGVALEDVMPATADGGTLTATLTVDQDVPLGRYDVSVTFTNDDDEPESATCTVEVAVAPPTDVPTPISRVQGTGDSSPLAGFPVTVVAVVTSVLTGDEEGDQLGGFFVEEERRDRDDDPQTSEGVFVFAGAHSDDLDLETGNLVRVTGTVGERFGQTQINASEGTIEVVRPRAPLPGPVVLDELPEPTEEARAAAWEPLEGMRVRLAGTWTVTDNFNTHRFGELEILPGTQPLQWPTNVMEPGDEAGAIEEAILDNYLSITLDDTRDGDLVEQHLPAPYFSDDGTGTIRRGTTLDDQVLIMSYGFGSYRLRPVDTEDNVAFDYAPRPPVPEVAGDVMVTSFNVLNYFNGDGMGGGFPTERGAETFEEFQRQEEKIVSALAELDSDVFGLIEIENDGTGQDSAVDDLLEALNSEVAGERKYDVVDTGPVGDDAIKNAFIYDTATVTLEGFDVLDDVDPFTRNTRPAIAARFVERATGEEFVPIVNHFKSKGSGEGDNANMGDGQGASNADRVLAAQELVEWTETDKFFGDDDRILVIGDLNAYAEEDPIDVFTEDNGYTDLLDVFYDDSDREAYTYAFFGAEGRLDHALANPEALEVVQDAVVWHINADEPRGKDYTFFNQPELYEPDPYRSSDHDPVLVGLQLEDIEPAVVADLSVDIRATPTRGAKAGTAPLRFTVRVSNDGPQTASGTVVQHELTLPPGATVERVDVPRGTSFDDGTLTWTVGDLEAGATERLVIVVSTTRESVGEASLTATVDSEAVDPSEGDNVDTAEVRVGSPPGGGRGGR